MPEGLHEYVPVSDDVTAASWSRDTVRPGSFSLWGGANEISGAYLGLLHLNNSIFPKFYISHFYNVELFLSVDKGN